MPNLVKIEVTPPPPPVSLGEVTLTMPVETATALAGLLGQLPLSHIDRKLDLDHKGLFEVFDALYQNLVLSHRPSVGTLYADAKAAVNRTVKIVRQPGDPSDLWPVEPSYFTAKYDVPANVYHRVGG